MCNHLFPRFLTALNFIFSFFSLNIPIFNACIYGKLYDQCNSQFHIIFQSIIFLLFSSFGTCLLKISPRISWFLDPSVHFLHPCSCKFDLFTQKNICFHPWRLPKLWSSITLSAKTNLPSCTHFTLLLSNDKVFKQQKFIWLSLKWKCHLCLLWEEVWIHGYRSFGQQRQVLCDTATLITTDRYPSMDTAF